MTDRTPNTQSDSALTLRDRIAAALKAQAEFRGIYKIADFDFQFLADAVIAGLGLEVTVTSESSDGRFKSWAVEGYWEEREGRR